MSRNNAIAFFVVFFLAFTISYLLFQNDEETAEHIWAQGTFCENQLEIRRMVSSRYPTEFDTAPDEYYTRGVVSASINFDGQYLEAKDFATEITESVFSSPGPNFAGHYTVASWSCGDTCQNHAVVDNNTGEIVAYGLGSEYGVKTSLDTKVLVLNPKENLPSLEDSGMAPGQASYMFAAVPREYYVLSNDGVNSEVTLSLFCTESAGAHYQTKLD